MLRPKDPSEQLRPYSRVWWVCDCGNEIFRTARDVWKKRRPDCGRCDVLTAEEISRTTYGKLRMKEPRDTMRGSHEKILWTCECGREKPIDAHTVFNGLSKSCGRCFELSAADMSQKFGRLRMKSPEPCLPRSTKKVEWTCECGQEKVIPVYKVLTGHTSSCGRCFFTHKKRFDSRLEALRALKTPILPSQIPEGTIRALETITSVSDPFRALCAMCGKEYHPRWDGIRLGKSLTCGCSTNRVSVGAVEIQTFVEGLGLECKTEYRIGNKPFDLFVPAENLIVEFSGLLWHSNEDSSRRDLLKRRIAASAGHFFLMVFEDEWYFKKDIFKNLLRNRLRKANPTNRRISDCSLEIVPASAADPFFEKFHYIGGVRAKENYAAVLEGEVIACMSFKRPTRQSSHPWELVRMAQNPSVRIRGIWGKLLKRFVRDRSPSSIVSFSDDRLFSGGVYEKIGFRRDGRVDPDYYWWKNKKRIHKSGLRKTAEERTSGLTENELRTAQGFRKVWDLGKTRWVWEPEPRTNPGESRVSGDGG